MINHEYVSDEKIRELLGKMRNNPTYCMMLFLSLNGFRSINFRKLVCDEVYNADGSVRDTVYLSEDKNKGKYAARYYINTQLKKELEKYHEFLQKKWGDKLSGETYLFTPEDKNKPFIPPINKPFARGSIWRIFRKMYKKIGITGASHMGRHIFITKMIDKGINPFIVQQLVNHRSIQTTQRYYNADPRRLLNAVETVEF